jgi:hypothetical protein
MIEGIALDLKETGLEDMDWIRLVQESDQWQAVVNMLMNLRDL